MGDSGAGWRRDNAQDTTLVSYFKCDMACRIWGATLEAVARILRFAVVPLLASCSRTPAAAHVSEPEGPAVSRVPEAPAEPDPLREARPEDLGEGFDAQLRCAPTFCDGEPWLRVDFTNLRPNALVLEVPHDVAEPTETGTWTSADVTGTWEDGSGFMLGGSAVVRAPVPAYRWTATSLPSPSRRPTHSRYPRRRTT